MELSGRKRAILNAIIKSYIDTGEPVGSKALCALLDMGLSSATLRNEMSELCEHGWLEQPHTSAGRIPTNAAYRLYIDSLMERHSLSAGMRTAIDNLLAEAAKDPERMALVAGQMLADLVGFPTLQAYVPGSSAYVRRLELMPMGRRTILIVLITSDGRARSRICRSGSDLTAATIDRFDRMMTSRIIGSELSGFTAAFMQSLTAEAGEYILALAPLIACVFEMAEELHTAKFRLNGGHKRLSLCDDERDARRLEGVLARQDELLPILAEITRPVDVVFGTNTGIDELRPSNMVVARYKMGGSESGRIGVIGPTRMAYDEVVPSIEYFAARLEQMLQQAATDMEE